jgi:NAD-dependent deacetylase
MLRTKRAAAAAAGWWIVALAAAAALAAQDPAAPLAAGRSASEDPWLESVKAWSEVARNFAQLLAVLGAGWVVYRWRRERRDRATDVLLHLEERFASEGIQRGCELVDDDAAYATIRRALVGRSVPPDEAAGEPRGHGTETAAEREALAALDRLLRFYILLLGIQPGQVRDEVLATTYRYWLAQCFNPARRELRLYVTRLFPALGAWIAKEASSRVGDGFLTPERFGWKRSGRATPERVRQALEGRVLVITGAGISAESGIPTYRGEGGFWRGQSARALATRRAFAADASRQWAWYLDRRRQIREAEPNDAHRAIGRIGSRAAPGEFLLVTQNVDDLHERGGAGREALVHIHGEIFVDRCPICSTEGKAEKDEEIPSCPKGHGVMRPGVIWFDEDLDPVQASRVEEFLKRGDADLVLVVGTSARFDYIVDWALRGAGRTGCLVEVNPEDTCLTPVADLSLRQPAGQALAGLFGTR